MKPDADPTRPFREMLSEDAAHLPAMAARAAREACARRARHRRRWGHVTLLALLGVGCWHAFDGIRPDVKGRDTGSSVSSPSIVAGRGNFIRARTLEEAQSRPLPPPPGATPDQKDLLESARGLPLLLVLDASGKPERIWVVER